MEIGAEISQKIRSAIKAKLIELGAYVDDELPDYIMVMVANKKSQKQMTADLSLFLGTSTEKFSIWLHGLLKKLQSINTDEPGSKHKAKEKHKVEKKKHKTPQGEKEKAAKTSEPERQRKSSTGEKEKPEKKKVEDKTETSTVNQDVQDVEEVHNDAIEISENTDEFNEENKEAEKNEQVKSSSTGKPPPTKVSKSVKSSDVKKASAKSSTKSSTKDSSKSKPSSSGKQKSESKDPHKKPSSFVASVKRRYEEVDEEEEYDPANPAVGSVASIVRGPQRKSSVPKSLQANKSLLMKAVNEAEKSVTTKKKTEPSAEYSQPTMRSDRKPVDLKKRLKTAAGLGLLSRSKRTELEGMKYKIKVENSEDVVKKPRRSSEGFENMKYTIKNEAAAVTKSPPKKTPPKPKAPPVAPSRVALSAFREMGEVSKVVKKEVKEPESDVDDEEYGPPLPDTRLVQRSQPDEDSTDHTDSNSRDSPVEHTSEVSDNIAADPEIQQLLDEAHETLDLNDDLDLVYEEDGKRRVRDSQSVSPEPKFIVTLDGVNPQTFEPYVEPKQNPVQTVKPVPKQKPVVEAPPQQQQLKPLAAQTMETTEQIFAKIAPTKIKPFNISLKDTDDEDEGEEMDTEEAEPVKQVINERCRFWPACANGNDCQFIHPSIPCKTFPYCKFGEKCLYIHPNCRFDANCTRMDCPYTHSSKRMGLMSAPTVIHKILQVPMQSYIPPVQQYQSTHQQYQSTHQQYQSTQPTSTQCRFFPNCTNMACPFTHPKPCRYGIGCMNKNTCTFHHPPLPGKDKLRWSSSTKKDSSEKTTSAATIEGKK